VDQLAAEIEGGSVVWLPWKYSPWTSNTTIRQRRPGSRGPKDCGAAEGAIALKEIPVAPPLQRRTGELLTLNPSRGQTLYVAEGVGRTWKQSIFLTIVIRAPGMPYQNRENSCCCAWVETLAE